MIDKIYCYKVLNVGCDYKEPKGGVAQVMNSYSQFVYNPFRCVVNSCDGSKLQKLWVALYAIVKTFFFLLFDRRIKILHIHTASYNSFYRSAYWINLGKFFHKKIVLHIHGGGFKEFYASNPIKIKHLLDKCDCLITLSQSWKAYFENELHCKHVEVVENIVPHPQIQVVKKENAKFHLLFLGLIHQDKGIFDLLEAIAMQNVEWQNKILLRVGGNGAVSELKNFVSEHHLQNCVKYEGFVSGEKKINLLNLCDAFILPSYVEGMPISILEAMSYAKPILSTPVGGIPEVITDGVNGYMVTPGNQVEMIKAISMLLEDRALCNTMGRRSFEMVQSSLPNNVALKLSSIYNNIL